MQAAEAVTVRRARHDGDDGRQWWSHAEEEEDSRPGAGVAEKDPGGDANEAYLRRVQRKQQQQRPRRWTTNSNLTILLMLLVLEVPNQPAAAARALRALRRRRQPMASRAGDATCTDCLANAAQNDATTMGQRRVVVIGVDDAGDDAAVGVGGVGEKVGAGAQSLGTRREADGEGDGCRNWC